MTEEKIKLLIADDHAILRHGLRRILEAEPDMSVVGEAATGVDAVKLVRKLTPDVVIMDISMPEQDGIESMRQIVQSLSSKVLILTIHTDRELISKAVLAGASGYMAKDSLDRELVSAVRTIVHGGTVFSSTISKALAQPAPAPQNSNGDFRTLKSLTAREREVFALLAEGKTPTEVANSLLVSTKTVHTHRQHIMEKLALRTTTDLIRYALRQGVINTV